MVENYKGSIFAILFRNVGFIFYITMLNIFEDLTLFLFPQGSMNLFLSFFFCTEVICLKAVCGLFEKYKLLVFL